jgi:tetratricopeptide (TPR) repeat protein
VALAITSNVDTLTQDAALYLRGGRLQEAAESYRKLLEIQPENPIGLFNLARTLEELGQGEGSRQYEKRFLAQRPGVADIEMRKAVYLFARGKFAESIACYQTAASMGYKEADMYRGLGDAYYDSGRPSEALESYTQAQKLTPRDAVLWALRMEVHFSLAQYQEAIECARKALAIDPGMILPRYTSGLAQLLLGDYEKGWALNEERLKHNSRQWLSKLGVLTNLELFAAKPNWQGEDLQGKTILIWSEQGMGDAIMMMRYIPLLKARGASGCIVYCPPALVKTMLTMTPLVVSTQTTVDNSLFDVHCSMMSLPFCFGTRVESIPVSIPYLTVEPAAQKNWGEQLRRFPGLKVGLVWAGNPRLAQDKMRSIAFEKLAPLFDVPGVQFVSLQKESRVPQEQLAEHRIIDWMPACADLMDTAALISQLDLVIAVDTMIAHLAGALGKPVWLLNRFESEWRWMAGRSDSPWYPSMRIFRQAQLHEWHSVIKDVVAALSEMAGAQAQAVKELTPDVWQKTARDANHALGIANAQSAESSGWRQKLTSFWKD